ncbi:MFS general substrate transporter [Sodiomyces alkalinus F11]|uniref:MFS general substrate transporter n=1 Tax=Sodiomyces alkalinus (strain CBS 110278 / VKM F-3762 / F11) TaxID=1314773 RepID=A0A3N2Q114_SODAK|nr:MFS general substrate transporter [Sodiomyces alkalinus F11]ROT40441.1 MFS general substrate transporter [Sodiomyces alkalinus F11]
MSETKSSEPSAVDVQMVEKTQGSSPSGSELARELHPDPEERTTAKAWLCIGFLTLSFGGPFWATPTTAAISAQLLGLFGQSELSAWVIPCITTAATVTILLFGANSDLFGRRAFLLTACLFGAVGYIICAVAKSTNMLIAGLCLNGVASGMSGIALIAVPELIANKYRHIGIVIADLVVYIFIVIGPIVARFTLLHDDDRWRYLYWAGFIMQALALVGLFIFYHPPKHPRGIPWMEALKGMDWIGGVLFSIGAVLILVGIVYTSYLPANDIKVIVCFVVGFATIIAFGLWEQFSNVRFPLCPRDIFASNKGREFAVPFCLSFVVVGYFYGVAVIYPTMLNAFYVNENTSVSEELLLTLPSSLPLVFGAFLLTAFGRKVGHWKWSMTVSVVSLVIWGSLLALITPHNKAMMISFVAMAQLSYGWAAYLAVTYTQLGVPQEMLGISGGLAGTARYAGGAVASACYSTAIANGFASKTAELVPKAALEAGLPEASLEAVVAAAGGGARALAGIPGVTPAVIEAVVDASKWASANGLRNAALVSMAFGLTGVVLCLFLEDIEPKMTPKIEIFLENDILAEKNKYH